MKRTLLIASLALVINAQQLHAAHTLAYIQKTGSNLNSGFLDSGDTGDPDDAASVTLTGGNWVAATGVFTSAGSDLSSIAVGEFASVYASGATVTGFVGRVTAVDDGADTVTVSLAAAIGTPPTDGTGNRALKIGGAWAGPSGTEYFPFTILSGSFQNAAGDFPKVYLKGDGSTLDYAVTDDGPAISRVGPIIIEGYNTTPGDKGLVRFGGTTSELPFFFFNISGANWEFENIWFDRNGVDVMTNTDGPYMVNITGVDGTMRNCRFTDSWRSGFRAGGSGWKVLDCEFARCNVDGANAFSQLEITEEGICDRTLIHHSDKAGDAGDCSGIVSNLAVGETCVIQNTIIADNGGDGIIQNGNSTHLEVINCSIVRNGSEGILLASSSASRTNSNLIVTRTIFSDNGGAGVDFVSASTRGRFIQNAFYSNTDGEITDGNSSLIEGSITLTGDPFVDAANGDWRLNNTSGAGAACRGLTYSHTDIGSEYSATTTSYYYLGAVGPQESGGSAGTVAYSSAN